MYMGQFMMGILVASTAFVGLTGVVIGQMVQQRQTRRQARRRDLLAWSCVLGIIAILTVLSWFITLAVKPEVGYRWILAGLANTLFVVQLALFVFGAFTYWGAR